MSFHGKNIVLGICGSIAAYKSAYLTRLLVKSGANVQVIMTPDACHFIAPLTLSTLSKRAVLTDYFEPKSGTWNNHVQIATWADIVIIAPATANTLAKLANGICDNLQCAVYLSARCPIYLAPAMDLDMWIHESTKRNIEQLRSYGNHIIQPGTGELASGLHGEGRMAEPEDIIACVEKEFSSNLPLLGKRALVTAGPTYEAIDPVRFIGNHSSGKMGFAIAKALQNLGAEITLITGPSILDTPNQVNRINVISSSEMHEACLIAFATADITVMSAAVADYKPKTVAKNKIKKGSSDIISLQLEKTTDILAALGKKKKKKQLLIGFALETNDELANAKSKLIKKNLDFIVLNSLQDKGAGFGGDQNKITILSSSGEETRFDLKPKTEVAKDICNEILLRLP